MPAAAFDLSRTYAHLGLGSTVSPLPDFEWTSEYLAKYEESFASDGDEGRIVVLGAESETWSFWERHPAGEELVVLISGRVDVIQDLDGAEHLVELRPGHAMINPRGIWHTATVHEPGQALFITPGRGTE
ncbi:MAG: hypothetical protein ACRDZP_06910, partial [Acidimicrobiales bacterium]